MFSMATLLCVGSTDRPGCKHTLADHAPHSTNEEAASPSFENKQLATDEDDKFIIKTRFELGDSVVLRTSVVDEVIFRVCQLKFIVVRGTPAVGKTTLCRLICNRLLEGQKLPVHVLTGWEEDSVKSCGGWEQYLAKKTGIHGRQWITYPGFLLLDEAQEGHWDTELWASFFKTIAGQGGNGPFVITFSSYGSPGGGYQGLDDAKRRFNKTPMVVDRHHRISLLAEDVSENFQRIGLLYDKTEAMEAINKKSKSHKAIFQEDLAKEIYTITGGHAGAIDSLVYCLAMNCSRLYELTRQQVPISLQEARENIFSRPAELFERLQYAPFARGLPSRAVLQSTTYSALIKKIITAGGRCGAEEFADFTQTDVEKLVENGWVHTDVTGEDVEYSFASPLHMWFCEAALKSKEKSAEMPYQSPLELALEAIKRFCPAQLSGTPRAYDDKHGIFEDQWQKEFYRCLLPLLDRYVYVCPEFVVKRGKGGGRVDFQLVGTGEKWAIELVRESDRLEEHCKRFQPGGAYHSAVVSGIIDKFVILNFTTTLPKGCSFVEPDTLFHVLFKQNFRQFELVDGVTNEVKSSYALLENTILP